VVDVIAFLAVLAVLAQLAVIGVGLAWTSQRLGSRRPLDAITRIVGPDALRLAWLVALVATAGSLYFSEVRHFAPCPLCWYQRIAMYPLALVLGIAAFTNDRRIRRYVLPVTLVGAAISAYHYQLERFPDQEAVACSKEIPCTTIWFEQFGYITLPLLALSGFLLIATLVWLGGRHGQGIANEA
jgi:disulfide bond formation protein DsbB